MQNLDLKNKTVFITGVAGFIGSNLAERLLKEIEGILSAVVKSGRSYEEIMNFLNAGSDGEKTEK